MTRPTEDWEVDLWARSLRRRWWRAALAPFRDMLSTAAKVLLHRLQARRDRIWLATHRPIRRQSRLDF
jgi:hypothetical protein